MLGVGTSNALADTPNNTTRAVSFVLDTGPGIDNGPRYENAILQIRQAAGHEWRSGDLYESQTTPAGLVAIRILRAGGAGEYTTLYMNPENLYIGGFRAGNGELYAFNDASQNVRDEMARGGPVHLLPFGGSYGGLRAVLNGSVGYEEPRYANMLNMSIAATTLNEVPNPYAASGVARQDIARSMLYMIGAFSEGARFTTYRDIYRNVFNNRISTYQEIWNYRLESLRTSWSPLSRFAYRITNDPNNTAPLLVPHIGTFSTYNDVHNILRVVLSTRRSG
ncbi:ribosome-inactivating family protein [Streptomyces sp. NPDC059402]|uniref:ribosome-inactivating family protein n=1 Tax=Streptomyces sp. NPDC059402 TaxID=3346822 RepID=UPI0036BD52EC